MKTATEIVSDVRQLPSLEPVIVRLLESFDHGDPDANALSHDIAQDQALVARVLRLANSPFYGLQSRVDSIREAVMVLGFRNIRAAVVAIAVTRCFVNRHVPGFDAAHFWRHSMAVGIVAREIARYCRRPTEIAFAAGIVHDIGVLVLMSVAPKEMAAVLDYGRTHRCMIRDAEQAVLGTSHPEIGACLAERWAFPISLRDAIQHHHDPEDATADSLANLVHVADVTVRALGLRGDDSTGLPRVSETALNRLAISSDELQEIIGVVEKDLEPAYQAFFG